MTSLPIFFTKMSGAGNTFAIVSGVDKEWGDFEKQIKMPRAEFAKMICNKTFGLCTDGLLILEKGTVDFDYRWDFYNSDGSTAEMCGNASRCAARYCYEILANKKKSQFRFMTGAGVVETEILSDESIRVQMPVVKWIRNTIELKIPQSGSEAFALVNTGVPHLVQKLQNVTMAGDLKEMARQVRHHQDIKPEGANVTFYSVDDQDKISAITFERGVEDYTLACGTGAVAAAFVHKENKGTGSVEVSMPGGHMKVVFPEESTHPFIEGSAVFVGDFKYSQEVFL